MKLNARIPVIPLPYKDKDSYGEGNGVVEKELLIDYGDGTEFPNLYVVDAYDKNKIWDITEGIRLSIQNASGDNYKIEIDGLGTIKLGDVLNILYTISLTHDEAWSVETLKKMIPTTIVDNNGVVYAPRTLSTAVYTESGESIDVRLKSFTKLGMTERAVPATEELQSVFEIPYPFPNYLEEGNFFWVKVGGVIADPDTYYLSEDKSKIIFELEDDWIQKDRDCTFIFWYNSATPDTGVLLVMDGKYITPGTIETNRLAEVSDSINFNSPDCIASSRAVCTLRNVLNERIDRLAGNLSVTCMADSTSTASKIVVKIPNYKLIDSNMLHIRLSKNLAPGATIQVNDEQPIAIYNGDNPVIAGPKAGEIINVSYNSLENKFYIYGVSEFKLETTYYTNAPEEGSSNIPFKLSYDPLVDKLDIWYNGLRMFPGRNYTMNESSIDLVDFISEAGDLFTFELTQIVPVAK